MAWGHGVRISAAAVAAGLSLAAPALASADSPDRDGDAGDPRAAAAHAGPRAVVARASSGRAQRSVAPTLPTQAATALVRTAQAIDRQRDAASGLPYPVNEVLAGALLLTRRVLLPTVPEIPTVKVSNTALVEGGADNQARFTVTLDRGYDSALTLGYATRDDTAAAGLDYLPAQGTLTFVPGQTTAEVAVAVLPDDLVETTEQFDLGIFATMPFQSQTVVTGADLAWGRATIFSDDVPAVVNSGVVDLSNWMTLLPGVADLQLTDLPIPGTHDSATSSLSTDSPWAQTGISDFGVLTQLPGWLVKPFVVPWARAHPDDVFTQLVNGIRYLDLRLSMEPDGQIYLEHGLRGPTVDTVLDQIELFADALPREVLFVSMSRFTGDFDAEAHATLLAKIRQTLGDRMVPAAVTTGATLRDLWAIDRNVIVLYGDTAVAAANSDVWFGDIDFQPWPNVQTVEDLLERNRAYLQERNALYPFDLWGLSGTVTPDTEMIVRGLAFGLLGPSSLKALMRTVHPALQDWLRGEFRDSVNLVTTDWYSARWPRGSYVRDVLGSVDGAYL